MFFLLLLFSSSSVSYMHFLFCLSDPSLGSLPHVELEEPELRRAAAVLGGRLADVNEVCKRTRNGAVISGARACAGEGVRARGLRGAVGPVTIHRRLPCPPSLFFCVCGAGCLLG